MLDNGFNPVFNNGRGETFAFEIYEPDSAILRVIVLPTPYTLHLQPSTLHATPYTLHPSPCTLHPTPYTLHPTPYTLHPTP